MLYGLDRRFLSADGLGGSDGGAGFSGGQESSGDASSAQPAEPSVIDLSDDALIRVKGSDKPVKFSEHVRGFQSQFTKASQQAAELKRQLAEREKQIQEYRRQTEATRQPQQDPFAQIKELPYLTGQDAVGVVQQLQTEIQKRDKILVGALQQMKSMQESLGGINKTRAEAEFEGKINRWLKEHGHGDEFGDLARETYLAYEGDDLDEQFPQILNSRIAQLEKAFEARRQAKVNAARKVPFLPGRGGNASPSKPLKLKANANPRDLADEVWNMMHGGEET